MKLCRSECGEMCLAIPARLAKRRTMRVAAWRSRRRPERLNSSGPLVRMPCVVQEVSPAGELSVRVGHGLVDEYLEFVAARARPNTLLATAFDLKVFFEWAGRAALFTQLLDRLDEENPASTP